MSEQKETTEQITQHTHHHHSHSHRHSSRHRHQEKDWASTFKEKSLMSIKNQKLMAKWGLRILFVIAVLMAIATFVVYHID